MPIVFNITLHSNEAKLSLPSPVQSPVREKNGFESMAILFECILYKMKKEREREEREKEREEKLANK